MNESIHVTPVNDLYEHTEDASCPCVPKVITGDMYPLDDGAWVENTYGSPIYIHNAWDGRE